MEFTLIIPAYNEAERLPLSLSKVRGYLSRNFADNHEVLVVDDGSRDGTAEVVRHMSAGWSQLRVLSLPSNRGKGGAVRTGVLAARGRLILFADADGATPIGEERRLRGAIEDGADLAVGSRVHRSPGVSQGRLWHRELASRLFSGLVLHFVPVPVRDTQCGFKMFKHNIAMRLFVPCPEEGYLFDLYILALAERLGLRIAEIPIHWSDVPGSKLNLFRDSFRMASRLPRLRRSIKASLASGPTA